MKDLSNADMKRIAEKLTAVVIDVGLAIVAGNLDRRTTAIDNAGELVDLLSSLDDEGV